MDPTHLMLSLAHPTTEDGTVPGNATTWCHQSNKLTKLQNCANFLLETT